MEQPLKARQKMTYNVRKLESGVVDRELFKKLEGTEIWELWTLFGGICYRLFAFWDDGRRSLVVVTHGIVKKTQRLPAKEIARAEALRREFFRKTIAYMANLKLTPASVMVDEVWGHVGTPERDAMEAQLKAEADAYFVGEAIRKARLAQNLTQEELGERVGVKRAQICKLERGKGFMTLSTLGRVFRALGVTSATLDLGSAGRVALW